MLPTGRPGPVVVDIPKDTVNPTLKYPYEYPKSVELRSYNPTVNGHKGQIKKALKALLVAKKPVLFVGGGAIAAGCHEEFNAICTTFKFTGYLIINGFRCVSKYR